MTDTIHTSAQRRSDPPLVAITRVVSPDMGHCQLTHLARLPINVETASEQHLQYEACLEDLGCMVQRLPAGEGMPDCVFVEDTAVVVDEVAVITRPGATSRRAEGLAVAEALRAFREVRHASAPGTLDGGDVLRLGRRVFVGMSSRTSSEGIDQLRSLLAPFDYEVMPVELTGCLHLKTAVTVVGRRLLVVNREWVDPRVFGEVEVIDVDPAEPFGANALLVNGTALVAAAHPRTRARLEGRGVPTRAVNVSEIARAEGGVTCCSLIFPVRPVQVGRPFLLAESPCE